MTPTRVASVLLVAVALLAGCGTGSDAGATKDEYVAEGDELCAEVQVEAAELARRAQELQAQGGGLDDPELLDRAAELWADQIDVIERYRDRFADLEPPPGDEGRHDELVASLDDGLETARAIKATLDDEERLPQELVQAYAATVESGNALARVYGFRVCGR